jgi:DNA-3-methyladenine glycosylase I
MISNLRNVQASHRLTFPELTDPVRCWQTRDPLILDYHDYEWGLPVHDDGKLFEALVIESFVDRDGLASVLRKRGSIRRLLGGFDYGKISAYSTRKIESLAAGSQTLNLKELEDLVCTATAFSKVQEEFGSFSHYIWGFTCGMQIREAYNIPREIPDRTPLSDTIAMDMRKRGFRHSDSTLVYSYLQAVGIVNDHLEGCFRCKEEIEQFC